MFWISPHNSSSINRHFTHFSPFFIQPPAFLHKNPMLLSPPAERSPVCFSLWLPANHSGNNNIPVLSLLYIKAWISLSLKLQGSFIAPFTIKPGNNGRIKIAFAFVGNALSIFFIFHGFSCSETPVYGSDNGFTQPYSENKFSIFCKIYVSPDPWNKL